MNTATPHRILVVDDNPAIHEDFRKILTASGTRKKALAAVESVLFDQPVESSGALTFDLDSAFQGQEALAKVEHALATGRPYALAFVDIRMPPGWDGVETIERLWKADASLQVVICTAYSDYSWDKMHSRLGLNDNLVILKKPFDNIEVIQLAHALTKEWTMTQQAQLRLGQLDEMVTQRTAELSRSEERFATAFLASPLALAIQTLDESRFVDVNDAFATLTGYERCDILGRTPVELRVAIDYDGSDSIPARISPARIPTRSGELREVLVSSVRLTIAGDPHVLLLLEDVSDRVRLEGQLRQAQKMEAVGQLAAGVAHDFNNLLTIIQGHASLMLGGKHPEETVESLEQIVQAADRAADVTRQLLAFSRQQFIRPRVLHLNDLLNGLLSMFRRVLGERIELNCEFGEEVSAIYADQTSVEQVVMNLLLNARDAMPRGGSITLGTGQYTLTETNGVHPPEAQPGTFAFFSVTDTGVGMDESTRAHIFEPFFTTKEVNKGTGMGLATVYGIASQHDGWIDVVTALGKGSTFRVFFPVTDRILEPPQARATVAAGSDRPHTIMVVEDDASVRSLVCEILEHHGYRVIEAESGDHALTIWPEVRDEVELLLTDMVMPGELNGLELAQKLLADRPDIKVIYTSGYSSELFSSDISLEEGRNYLPKPYFTAGIIHILRNALDAAAPVRAVK